MNVINVVQNITMAQKKRCAGNLAESPRWWSPAAMLQQLWSLIPQWYREQWLLHCRVVVVSERLALQARELGWQEIQVADSADNDALLRALQ